MDNTGRLPVCRGLASETQQQHASKAGFCVAVGGFTAHRLRVGALASISACMCIVVPRTRDKDDPFVWPRGSAFVVLSRFSVADDMWSGASRPESSGTKVALGRSIISTDLRRSMFHGDDAAHPAKIDCDVL